MASSNIKIFDENKGNLMADEAYAIDSQRVNGVQSGIASSQLQNKTLFQVSLMAYALAQIMNQNGIDANDYDAVSTFVNNLSSSLLQKVNDKASTAQAQAGTDNTKWMTPALVKAAIDYKLANPVTFGSTVTLAGDPTGNLQAATKQYVDNKINTPVKMQYELIEAFNVVFTSKSFNLKKNVIIPKGRIREIMLCVKAKNLNFVTAYSGASIGPGIYYGDYDSGATGLLAFGRQSTVKNLNADLTFRLIPIGNTSSLESKNTLHSTFIIASSGDTAKVVSLDITNDVTFRLNFYSNCSTLTSAEYDCELYVLR